MDLGTVYRFQQVLRDKEEICLVQQMLQCTYIYKTHDRDKYNDSFA